MEELRFGIIGCGEIGTLRADALSRIDSIKLVAVSDVDTERAQTVARKHGAAVFQDWRVLVRQEALDAVIVSTPPSLHAEMCIEVLQAGKNVLCEKPLGRTSEECRRTVNAAQLARRLLATGFNYRFYPSFRKAHELLKRGMIGELDHIRSYAGYSAAEHSHPWLRDATVTGGGALRDNGIHLIDLTRYFLEEVAEVKGFVSDSVWGFTHCEDNGFALLRSPAGKIATLQASWTEWSGYRFVVEIYGTHGAIRASCFPMITRVALAKTQTERWRHRIHLFPSVFFWEHLRSYRWVVLQSFVDELRAFAATIGGERTCLATGYDGLRAVEIAEEASVPLSISSRRVTRFAAV